MLKKEFNSNQDLQRIRNLITKKYGDATATQVGYNPIQEEHSEGDVWKEQGKWWTIKDGRKKTVKVQNTDVLKTPSFCPNCNKPICHRHDIHMIKLRGVCADCVIEAETKAKISGNYEEYEQMHMKLNQKAFSEEVIRDIEAITGEKMTSEMSQTEQGDVESWENGDSTSILEKIKEKAKSSL